MRRFAAWLVGLLAVLTAAAFIFGQPIAWVQAGLVIWDVAAGVCLCCEAGGRTLRRAPGESNWSWLRAFEAPPSLPLRKWNGAILTANPPLVDDLAARVQAGQEPFGNARPPAPQDRKTYEF